MPMISGYAKGHDEPLYTAFDINRLSIYELLYDGDFEGMNKLSNIEIPEPLKHSKGKLKINMAKVSASYLSQLLYNENVQINIGNEQASAYIEQVFKTARFKTRFPNFLEKLAALSVMTASPYWNGRQMSLRFADPFSFVPTQQENGIFTGGAFVSSFTENEQDYTLLEWNEKQDDGSYKITNELYKSSDRFGVDLGQQVPLSTLPQFADMPESTELVNVTETPFFSFSLNNANNHDDRSYLGLALYDNALDTMMSLNEMFDQFYREFKLGQKRIMVPKSWMRKTKQDADGNYTEYFDVDDQAFVKGDSPYSLVNPTNDDSAQPTDFTTPIRSSDFIAGINAMLKAFAMQIHLNADTFSFDIEGSQGVRTATEIISRKSETFQMRNKIGLGISEGIQKLVTAILEMGYAVGDYTGSTQVDVTIDFDDSLAQDEDTQIQRYTTAWQSGMIPQVEALMGAWNMPRDEAEKWAQQIADEKAASQEAIVNAFDQPTTGGN